MKVYVVVNYSDDGNEILGVFDKQEKAKDLIYDVEWQDAIEDMTGEHNLDIEEHEVA